VYIGRVAIDPHANPYKGRTGLLRLASAFFNSCVGLSDACRHESAFRQEIVLAALLVPTAFLLPVTTVERVLLVASVLLVLIVELLNTSVEVAIDRISLDQHALSRRAKDLGSAAVFLSLVLAATVWGLIVWPLLPRLFA
jgi:diacylglycerol kinase (ATP)